MDNNKVILVDANSQEFKTILEKQLTQHFQQLGKFLEELGYVHGDKMIEKEEVARLLGIRKKKSWSELINQYSNPNKHNPALPFYKVPGSKEKLYKYADVIAFRDQMRVERNVKNYSDLLD